MITVQVIGIILSLLGIYLFKGSRIRASRNVGGTVIKPIRHVLKVWHLLLYLLGAVIPIFSIIMGLVMIVVWAISVYGDKTWLYPETSIANKIMQFFNKSIQ